MTTTQERRDEEFIKQLSRASALYHLTADRYSNAVMDMVAMSKLLRSEGIVYGDTKVGDYWVGDEDRDDTRQIRKLFRAAKAEARRA